LVQYC